MRERLIELLLNCYDDANLQYYDLTEITDKFMGGAEYLADYLLKNGVVMLPCNYSPHIDTMKPSCRNCLNFNGRECTLKAEKALRRKNE